MEKYDHLTPWYGLNPSANNIIPCGIDICFADVSLKVSWEDLQRLSHDIKEIEKNFTT